MGAIGKFFENLGSSLASSASSGATGLVGQSFGALSNALFGGVSAKRNWKYYKKQANLDHQYNIQTMDHAAQIAKDQYAYEYEMESPEARVKQLRDAGLNKGLEYSGGATGMQGSVSSPAPATYRGSMSNMTDSSLAQLATVGSTVALNESVQRVNKANAGKSEQETENLKVEQQYTLLKMLTEQLEQVRKRIENEKDSTQLRILKAQEADLIQSVELENKRIAQQTATSAAKEKLAIAQTDTEKSKQDNLRALTALTKADTSLRIVQKNLEEEFGRSQRSFELAELAMSITQMSSNIELNNALADLNDKRANLTEAEFYLKAFDVVADKAIDALRFALDSKTSKEARERAGSLSNESKIGIMRLILPFLLKK